MSLSSSSLFHYTSSLEILKKIIQNGFSPSYCKEEHAAFAMVSFCDITLTSAIRFMDYGDYAIGMNKKWVKRNGLNPVSYIEKDSALESNFSKISDILLTIDDDLGEIDNSGLREKLLKKHDSVMSGFVELYSYHKPYEGRNDKLNKNNYRFYDEKEWRYIPIIEEEKLIFFKSHKEYTDYKKDHPTKPHLKDIKLSIKSADIDYLIVKDNNDILPLINFLETLDNIGSPKEIKLLTTRILTKEQIKIDF